MKLQRLEELKVASREDVMDAATIGADDPFAAIGSDQGQRSATLRALQDYTRLKSRATGPAPQDLAWLLVLDSLVFAAEAEVRWLDHCEARLARAATERSTERPTPATTDTSVQEARR